MHFFHPSSVSLMMGRKTEVAAFISINASSEYKTSFFVVVASIFGNVISKVCPTEKISFVFSFGVRTFVICPSMT
nr:MAG TPA: hypothetical protein [Caudoviricetes sp.]